MSAKRHRGRRKNRARAASGRAKAVAPQATPTRSGTAIAGRDADAGRTYGNRAGGWQPKVGSGWERTRVATPPLVRRGASGSVRAGPLPGALLLPGRTFFALGRPGSGLLCYALQASLVGWLPAALWAAVAARRVKRKQLVLAARLRPI